jgi:hypothetical protein
MLGEVIRLAAMEHLDPAISLRIEDGHARIQLRVQGQTLRSSDPAEGRGAYSSTFDASGGVRILAARRTVLQQGGTITLDQTGPLKKMISLTLPLYQDQKP